MCPEPAIAPQGSRVKILKDRAPVTSLLAPARFGPSQLVTVDLILRPERPIPTLLTLLAEVHELTRLGAELAG